MSLGALYQADIDKALDVSASMPATPPPKPSRGIWATLGDSLQGAGARIGASVLELGKVAGAAATIDINTEESLAVLKGDPDRIFRENELSRQFRDFERALRPDPATASTAEQIVYGLAGPAASLIGGALLGGLPGVGIMSAEMGFSESEDLAREGVSLGVRAGVGAVTAAANTAFAALPMAGQTLKSTAALYLTGGPGAFIAQQSASRAILEAADYSEAAQKYDPLDPTGLALSFLIPAPFAAYGAFRNVRANRAAAAGSDPVVSPSAAEVSTKLPAAAAPEQVDAAMTHNLTLMRQAQEEAVPDLFLPQEQREANFRAWFGDSKVVDGEGKPLVVYRGGATENWRDNSEITEFRSTNGPWSGFFSSSVEVANRFAEAQLPMTVRGGAPAGVFPVFVNIRRPLEIDAGGRPARDFQIDASVIGLQDSPIRAQLLSGEYDGLIVRGTSDEGDLFVPLRPEQVKSAIGNSGRFDPTSGSLTDPMPAPVVEPVTPAPDVAAAVFGPDFTAIEGSADSAVRNVATALRQTAADALDIGSTLMRAVDEFRAMRERGDSPDTLAERNLPPEVNNVVVGLVENARSPARVAEMVRQLATATREAKANKAPTADAAADVVERMRKVLDSQVEATAKPTVEPLLKSVNDRVQALEVTAPDLPVRVDDSGKVTTAREEMAAARKEAAEGTDTDIGLNEVDLVRVAAECALSSGAY